MSPQTDAPAAEAPTFAVLPVDITHLRDTFANLEQRIRHGVNGQALRDAFEENPLKVVKEQGVDLTALDAHGDVTEALQQVLRSGDTTKHPETAPSPDAPPDTPDAAMKMAPTTAPASEEEDTDEAHAEADVAPEDLEPEHLDVEMGGGFTCWACAKSAELAVGLLLSGGTEYLFGEGGDWMGAVNRIAPALAPVLGTSTHAAAETLVMAVHEEENVRDVIDRLAHEACKHVCG